MEWFCWFGQIKRVLIIISVPNSASVQGERSGCVWMSRLVLQLESDWFYQKRFNPNLFNLCALHVEWSLRINVAIVTALNMESLLKCTKLKWLFSISEVRISASSSRRQNHVLQSLTHCYCDDFLFNPAIFKIRIILSSPSWKRVQNLIYFTDRNNHTQHLLDLSPDFDQKRCVSKQSKHSKTIFIRRDFIFWEFILIE